jgi:hypothetical protein
LTSQNEGYEYIDKSKFAKEEKEAFDNIEAILKKHITGFHEFNNFRISRKTNELELRFQYSWTADDPDSRVSFSGVGYILLDELLNGFDKLRR